MKIHYGWVMAAIGALMTFAYGGVMPLYAALAREYFSQNIMGAILGAAMMISSLGMALGPSLGGWIFDTYGEYAWLYIGWFVIGLGAPRRPHSLTDPSRT